ncbi:FUSC family protein [Actinomadura gamaensis]|uniref:FUSC family protein n=1 Tax=Actinomadura gamaensis TaxID=1763541 RepID=A0ABV9TXZ3_9ACTN
MTVRLPAERVRDRLEAGDPGLVRTLSALRAVIGVALTLAGLGISGAPAELLVAGCFAPFTLALALGDGAARNQAFVVAAAVPLVSAVLLMGGALAPYPVPAGGVFVLVVFWAVYVRRYGARGQALGILAFMAYFLPQFLGARMSDLPGLYAAVAAGFAADAIVRFGLLRTSPGGTLRRLRRAFRTQLARVVLDAADLVRTGRSGVRAARTLESGIVRLHRSALMLEDALSHGVPGGAGELGRIARAEVAAQRLAVLAVRAAEHPAVSARLREHLVLELRAVHARLVRARDGGDGGGLGAAQDPRRPGLGTPAALLDVHDAIGELTRAVAGLRPVGDGHREHGPRRFVDGGAAPQAEGAPSGRIGLLGPGPVWRAAQVAAATAGAVVGAGALSSGHWYWAVLSAWVVFVNTESSGDVLVQGLQRLLGTVLGVACGPAVAAVGGGPVVLCVSLVCVFGIFWTPPDAYWAVSFFITCMIVTIFVLLGVFSSELLAVRVRETALGVTCGVLAGALVSPTTVRRAGGERLLTVLRALQRTRLPRDVSPLGARELDRALEELRGSLRPLVHPLNPRRAHRARARHLLALLESCAYHARSLAAVAPAEARPARPGGPGCDADAAAERVRGNLDEAIRLLRAGAWPAAGGRPRTLERLAADPRWARDRTCGGTRALFHLRRLDEATAELARALGGPAAGARHARRAHRVRRARRWTAVSPGRPPRRPRPEAGSGR